MSVSDIAVIAADVAAATGLGWWFFGPKRAAQAAAADQVSGVFVPAVVCVALGAFALAFGYNIAGIPIAAGLLYPFTGIVLSPVIAAAAMAASSLSVVTSATRLRRARIPDGPAAPDRRCLTGTPALQRLPAVRRGRVTGRRPR